MMDFDTLGDMGGVVEEEAGCGGRKLRSVGGVGRKSEP